MKIYWLILVHRRHSSDSGHRKPLLLLLLLDDALFALIKKLSHKERKRIRGLLYLPPGRREGERRVEGWGGGS